MLAAVESKGRKGFLPLIDNIVDGVEGIVLDCGCKTDKGNWIYAATRKYGHALGRSMLRLGSRHPMRTWDQTMGTCSGCRYKNDMWSLTEMIG